MIKKEFVDFGLDNELIKSVDLLDYQTPTEVQQQLIPLVLEGRGRDSKIPDGKRKDRGFCHTCMPDGGLGGKQAAGRLC